LLLERPSERYRSLAGAVFGLDLLARHMRRAYRRAHQGHYLAVARRRARRRRQRAARAAAEVRPAFRRPLPEPTIEQLQLAFVDAERGDQLAILERLGVLRTAAQLRLELRERYLLANGHDAGFGSLGDGHPGASRRSWWLARPPRGERPPVLRTAVA
jgi:hypothetical protein